MKAFEHTPYEVEIKFSKIGRAALGFIWGAVTPNSEGYHSNHFVNSNHHIPFEFENDVEVLPSRAEDPHLWRDMGEYTGEPTTEMTENEINAHLWGNTHDTFQDELPLTPRDEYGFQWYGKDK